MRYSTSVILIVVVSFVWLTASVPRNSLASEPPDSGIPDLSEEYANRSGSRLDWDEIFDFRITSRYATLVFTDHQGEPSGFVAGRWMGIGDYESSFGEWRLASPHDPAIMVWRDGRNCVSPHHEYPNRTEFIRVSHISEISILQLEDGICNGTVVRFYMRDGETIEKSLVSRHESHEGIWSYGPASNDMIVLLSDTAKPFGIELRHIGTIRLD